MAKPSMLAQTIIPTKALVITTDPAHPLYQDRALEDADPFLAQDMESNGWKHGNVVVVLSKDDPNKYLVVAGRRRTKAALAAGIKEIPAICLGDEKYLRPSDLVSVMVRENEHRKQNNTLARALEASKLLELRLLDYKPTEWPEEVAWSPNKEQKKEAKASVAADFGLSVSGLGHLLSVLDENKVSDALREALERDDLSFRAARGLLSSTKQEQEAALARLAAVMTTRKSEGRSVTASDVEAVTGKKQLVKVERTTLERIILRRTCPGEVKQFIAWLMDQKAPADLPYLPGRLDKGRATAATTEDSNEE